MKSAEEIQKALTRNRCMAGAYVCLYACFAIIRILTSFIVMGTYDDDVWFGWFNFLFSWFCLIICLSVYIYLIRSSFALQRLFRKVGYIEGYKCEKYLITILSFFSGYLIFWFIFVPGLILQINTVENFECIYELKIFFTIMQSIAFLAWPVCAPTIFCVMIW